MKAVTVSAYAKVNLTLDILARRPDGYHEIRSVMQTVKLHDTITLSTAPDRSGVMLEVNGDEAEGVPSDESNIVHRAARRLQEIAASRGIAAPNRSGLHILLTKRIPSQAGLGGGSSDCAATLTAIDRLFALNLTLKERREVAASLGSDVPFFLAGGTALVEGRGERVTPLPPYRPGAWVVIAKPPVGVGTADAYARLDAQPQRRSLRATETWEEGLSPKFGNDFHAAIVRQNAEIAAACDALAFGLGELPLLCGSGAALFRLMPSEEAARILADHIRQAHVGKVWTTQLMGNAE